MIHFGKKESNSKKLKKNSILVVFEGISGCGKSQYIQAAVEMLRSSNHSCYLYEWNNNVFFRGLADVMERHDRLSATAFSVIQYVSFKFDIWLKLVPALKKYDYVICDRYIYTGIVRDRCNDSAWNPFDDKKKRFFVPDFVFYVKADPDICYKRILKRGKKLRYFGDKTSSSGSELLYLKKNDQEYLKFFRDSGIRVVKVDNTDDICLDEVTDLLFKAGDYE